MATESDLNELVVVLPPPSKFIRSNYHPITAGHCRARDKAAREYRADGAIAGLEALAGRKAPAWKSATATVLYRYAGRQRTPQQLPDLENVRAELKHAVDGLQDMGILKNDRHFEIVGVEFEKAQRPEIVLRLRAGR